MLRYLKKYKKRAQYLTILFTIMFVGLIYLVLGAGSLSNPLSLIMMFAAFFISNFLSSRYAEQTATKHAKSITDKYDQDCDPKTFIEEGREIAVEVMQHPPMEVKGIVFLSDYCSALVDQGHDEDATLFLGEIYKNAQAAQNPAKKFDLFMKLYAPTRDLYGYDLAEECLRAAEAQISEDEKVAQLSEAAYTTWARKVHNAVKAQDNKALIDLFSKVFEDDAQLPRVRVWAASNLAAAYRELDDREQESKMLHCVVELGNAMSCVTAAKDRLAEL